MDWERRTAGWVERGLIAAEQRDALLADLKADPPSSRLPFADLALAVVVGAGTAMLLGSLVAVLTLFEVDKHLTQGILLAACLAHIGVGGVVRWLVGRPVAEGLWAAALPVAMISTCFLLGMPWRGLEAWLVFGLLVPAGLATAVAVVDRMSLLAFSAAATGAFPLLLQLEDLTRPYPEALLVMTALGIAMAAALIRVQPDRFATLGVQVPVFVLVGMCATAMHDAWLGHLITIQQVAAWESVLVLTCFGAGALVGGTVARSGWFLASGLFALVVAELLALALVGNLAIAAVVLGGEGLMLMVCVLVFLIWKAATRNRDSWERSPEDDDEAEPAA